MSDTVDYYIIRRQKVGITRVLDDFDISFV
ncbi:hypothetical protein FAES_3759 [Fibrella aestuarina BUZ 2]|uniref:Uncharacterized protein n=1 Tax=Fibrella aestuarina BUZ 2 TaxID=1166018 RepID=I0KCB3_9BACT|nr:hypothetical protein FAES_3759 [Fibrella aestuarina BUZ 2]